MSAQAVRRELNEISRATNIVELFRDNIDNRYRIPPFQREYAWKTSQVDDLLDDLKDFRESADSRDIYLLGQIIIADADDPIYQRDLIDGQQRFVTISLLLLALQFYFDRHSKEHGPLHGDARVKTINKHISSMLTFTEETREYRRIEVQEGAKDSYRAFVEGHIGPRNTDPSASNMWVNLKHLRKRLVEELHPKDSVDFYEFVVNRVALIRVTLRKDDEAIDFFEKMNDRGVRLTATDLMKNLLFQRFSADAYKDAQSRWTRSIRDLQKLGDGVPNTMPFLLKALLTEHVEHRVSASKIYREWKTYIRDSKDANKFFEDVKGATDYLDGLSNRTHRAGQSIDAARYLDSKQFWIPMLATRHYSEKVAAQIGTFISARTVLSLLSEEQSQVFERPISPWAHHIWELGRAKGERASFEDFLALERTIEVRDSAEKLISLLDVHVRQLSYSEDTKRVRLVLALASLELERSLKSDMANQPLAVFLNTDAYDIDHIYPSGLVGKSAEAKDLDERADFIGNLALLHNKENRAAGKGLPGKKVDRYFDQSLSLSKSLAWSESTVLGILENAAMRPSTEKKDAKQLMEWGSESMRTRAEIYTSLLRRALTRDLELA